jgi:hypothetical protein
MNSPSYNLNARIYWCIHEQIYMEYYNIKNPKFCHGTANTATNNGRWHVNNQRYSCYCCTIRTKFWQLFQFSTTWRAENSTKWDKIKTKVCPCPSHENIQGSRGIAPQHQMEVGGQLHIPGTLTPVKNPSTHSIWGWVNPRTRLDVWEKR